MPFQFNGKKLLLASMLTIGSAVSAFGATPAASAVSAPGATAVGSVAQAAPAAHDFTVVSVSKDATHPHPEGSKIGFLVNGMQGRTLVLTRGKTYTFNVDTGVMHDFYITTDDAGWGTGRLPEGVPGNF